MKALPVALLVSAMVAAGCAASSSSSSSSATTPAEKLATIQEGSTSSTGDPLVAQFQSALNQVKPACQESQDKVASEIWASWQDVQKNNHPTTLLHVAEAPDTVTRLTPNTEPTKCASLLAAYLVTAEAPGGQP
jgi:hypothetical protein